MRSCHSEARRKPTSTSTGAPGPRMISRGSSAFRCALLALVCAIAAALVRAQEPQLNSQQRQQLHHASIPGHFEFEVAPKMEPPSVRKPPYVQSAQLCPGSDPFAGFSPKDTLCGDLNQGRLPLNPLGQSVLDQAYPFELIKNKTLQFLARALPVLKLEYETIPKVARYLPSNQLLNPTHSRSPLSSEHMQQLNQRFGLGPQLAADQETASKRRRRRKRWAPSVRASSHLPDLAPNATLVFASAHSPGRIVGELGGQPTLQVLTKDGYKSITAVSAPLSVTNRSLSVAQAAGGVHRAHAALNQAGWSQAVVQQSNSFNVLLPAASARTATTSRANQSELKAPTAVRSAQQQQQQQQAANSIGNNGSDEEPKQQTSGQLNNATPASSSAGQKQQQQQQQQQQSASVPNQATTEAHNHARSSAESRLPSSSAPQALEGAQARSSAPDPPASASVAQSSNQQRHSAKAAERRRCADSTNAFSLAICQAANALIEGDKQPAWLQVVKHLSSVYSGAGNTADNAVASSNPIWSLIGGLTQLEPNVKSGASSGGNQRLNFWSLIGPLSNLISGVSAKDSSSVPQATAAGTSAASKAELQKKEASSSSALSALAPSLSGSTLAKLAIAGWATNALTGLVEYLAPSVFGSMVARNSGFARRKKPFDPSETFVDTPASMAANLKQQQSPSGFPSAGKQPPTPCPSVEEYISPTFARNYQGAWKYVVQIPHEGYFTQTIQRTSCVRQRCEFTEGVCHESPRWVSLLVAEIYYPNAVFSGNPQQQQQQQASASDQSAQLAANHIMAASSSNANIQQAVGQQHQQPKLNSAQDPLQMTDSLSNYNHNLNNAFINAANNLGWDPNNVDNMQQLANAYNYQLLQRNGLAQAVTGQNTGQPTAEARSSSVGSATAQTTPQQSYSPTYEQLLYSAQQPQSLADYGLSYGSANGLSNSDYILALASAALQQNPKMNANDLINSILSSYGSQSARKRKRRDLNQQVNGVARHPIKQPQFSAQIGANGQQFELLNSINDISAPQQMNNQHLQQTANVHHAQMQPINDRQAPANQAQQTSNASHQENGQTGADQAQNYQMECDGHDKIGCYVVRVYYDWFLVNGSCKCWKTSTGNGQSSSSSSNSNSANAGNSFLRRIFTG